MDSENKKKKPVTSRRIFTVFILLIVMVIGVFSTISIVIAKFRTDAVSYNNMVNAGTVISGIVSDYMAPKTDLVRSAANDKRINSYFASLGTDTTFIEMQKADGYDEVQAILNGLARSDKDIISAWVVSERSGAALANEGRYIPYEVLALQQREWYSDVISTRSAVCSAESSSMFDFSTRTVTVAAPVFSSDVDICGFVGMEVSTAGLYRIMEQYTLNSGCYPIICCKYGTVVYSPASDEFKNKFNVSQPPLINVLIQADSFYSGIDSYSSGKGINNTVYYTVDNVSVPGWSIVVVFDGEIMNGGIFNFLMMELAVLICLAVLAVIIFRNKLNKETALISQVTDGVQALAGGTYKYTEADYSVNNELTYSLESLNKISESISEKNEIIRRYTSSDILTGLPNRMSMYEKMETLIDRYTRSEVSSGNRFAVMFVDVDNFKWLNETLGHNFGDAVLCTFASVLSASLSKVGLVYRFSGDEFIIIVEFGNDYEKIQSVIGMMQEAFAKPIQVMTDNIYLKFSMGVSIFPDDDVTADMLLRDADLALHRSKEGGKDRVSFYTNTARKQSFSKAAIAQQVATALHDGEMYLNFQPILSAENSDIHGFEVLLRWESSLFGNISPTEFINVAEETGAIVQIGMWVFESACRFLKQLCEIDRDDIIISINVSPVQLKRADYIDSIRRVIEITQVNPQNIQFEITESTLIDFIDNKNSVIEQINDMGISIALDDFGTGYSSLNYLKNFPIKCLKIDKSFVDEINNDKRDYAITDSIIDLVHSLGIKTVAEGIETVGQYNFLVEMKCDYIQGFLMSKPLDEAAALEFVEMYDALHKSDSAMLAEHEKQIADEKRMQQEKESVSTSDETVLVDEIISK